MLNELNPAQKDKYVCFLICGIQDFIKRDEKAEGGAFGERNETGLGEPKRKMRSIYIVIIVPGGNPQGSGMCHTDTVEHVPCLPCHWSLSSAYPSFLELIQGQKTPPSKVVKLIHLTFQAWGVGGEVEERVLDLLSPSPHHLFSGGERLSNRT